MYPIFYLPQITSGWLIAILATFHILPSHLSTSAMWFNVYMEWKAYKENREELLEFVKKFALLLIVFAYIFGSLSGVGIWFATMVASPRGISSIIHNYVWGWATEWVFFIIEVLGIFIYYYTFGKVDKKTHLLIGLIFAIGSWTTMAIIVGILSFMISTGKWNLNGNFFYGFFNPNYFPHFLLRTVLMFSITALYAIFITNFVKNENVKNEVIKKASLLGILSILISIPFLYLYLKSLPSHSKEIYPLLVTKGLKMGFVIPLIIVFLYFVLNNFTTLLSKFIPSLLMIIILFGGIFAGERIREILRKPYIIPGFIYSNCIIGFDHKVKGVESDVSKINGKGILEIYPFTPPEMKNIDEKNILKAGKLIALIECSSCHSLENKGVRPLKEMIERIGFEDVEGIMEFLDLMGENYKYMPPFFGSEIEKRALAEYLISLKGR
ncbi:MAG: cytochrome c [candidate division WOR-3 bacterium]